MTTNQQQYAAGYAKGLQDAFKAFKFGAEDFEPKFINRICDLCGKEEGGTVEQLAKKGWSVFNGSEFCPECE